MTRSSRRGRGDAGYALVAAVASIAVFAAMAEVMIAATRVSITAGGGELTAARAGLAADGGLQTVLHSLALEEDATLALLGGGETVVEVDGARVVVRLADERGKVPLNRLDDATLDRLLTSAGLDDAQRAIARDSLLDWLDDDDLARADGAEAPYYLTRGLLPRNGALHSIDELGAVRGFTPRLVARLRPYITTEENTVSFDRRFAAPQALAVMDTGGAGATDAIIRGREAAGQRTALGFIDRKTLIGRPITITADALTADGGRAHRTLVAILTGRAAYPWVIVRAD